MKVILAKKAGFCMGVRRAVETTLDLVHKEEDSIATFGPLIHNPQVLALLSDQGVAVLNDIPDRISGTVIIRAHGISPFMKERLQKSGARVKDATCPRVVKVQAIIKKYRARGYGTVIIGDRNHAEVEGLMGFAGPSAFVVSNKEDVGELELSGPYIIVSQTTQDEESFDVISRMIVDRFPGGRVFNTICDSTHKRQAEVRNLCRMVQAVIVVGGRFSANSKRLAEIAEGMGQKVFFIETEKDLEVSELTEFDVVGVTAGASTPTWMINRVVQMLESIPGRSEGFIRPFLYKSLRFLLSTNIYISLAGGFLVYTCAALQGIETDVEHFFVAFGYLFAMHNLNRFMDQRSKKFNDPVKERFFNRYQGSLFFLTVLTLVIVLFMAFRQGMNHFFMIFFMSIFGILYSVRFIPKFVSKVVKVRRLKEIPGSKTLFAAMAWAFVIVLIPSWDMIAFPSPSTVGAFIFILLLVFVRNALFDVFDVQGDRIVGKETLPVFIGEKRTITLLHYITLFLVLMLLLFPFAGWMTFVGFWLIPGILYLIGLTYLYRNGHLVQGLRLEFYLETVFWAVVGLGWLGAFLRPMLT